MSSAPYQRLSVHDNDDKRTSRVVDPRFDRPSPPLWKRIALLAFIAFLFWLSFMMRPRKMSEPNVIHATRYSTEYKFRPAASPVITERLKDGRVRLRGAYPSA
ncbi:hypothetical protein F5I97DRAFT_140281 [Phlebopus sp. FC_14]|nr:hypothetical protein F5I97DRAFT_140281 [Phlebopus sp. FC_14]